MRDNNDELDVLVAKARRLPSEQQAMIVEMLREAIEEPHPLSDDELAILLPALEEARRGEGLSDAANRKPAPLPRQVRPFTPAIGRL